MILTEKEQLARKRVCLPLDGLNVMAEVEQRVEELSPVVGLFKVGKESFTRFGPKVVDVVQNKGGDVFLDLKYHDIPNTVRGAARAAAELQVYMFNVHTSGGVEMMEAAVEGANSLSLSSAYVPRITGVTVLTSLDNLRYVHGALPVVRSLPVRENARSDVEKLLRFPFVEAINAAMAISGEKDSAKKAELQRAYDERISGPFDYLLRKAGLENIVPDTVLNFSEMARQSGLDGVVCSAADLHAIRNKLPPEFMYVTPGIKGPNTPAGEDQKRVFTPGNAIEDGSSILVVGRAITNAKDRVQAGYDILKDMASHL